MIEGLEPLVYVDLDPMRDEALHEDINAYDVNITKVFSTLW